MDIKEIQKRTKAGKVKEDKERRKRKVLEDEAAKKKKAEEAEYLKKRIAEAIEYIEEGIAWAADKGLNTYIYDCGDHYEDEYACAIKNHFKDFNPRYEGVPGTLCLNYENGDYEDYVSNGIRFNW